METSVVLRPSVRSAFSRLIDYAGLYPPANLSLAQSQAEYRTARGGPHAWMLGRFIISVKALDTEGEAGDDPLSVIVDGGADPDAWISVTRSLVDKAAALRARGVAIEALEVPLPAGFAPVEELDALLRLREMQQRENLGELPVYVEFARREPWKAIVERAMKAAAQAGFGVKLRCGGVTADAFPTVEEVAEFIAGAAAARLPFKATAGLHHPVRHFDAATGFTMHGFLNVLTAASLAPRTDRPLLQRIIAEEDASAFRFDDEALYWRDERVDVDELEACRNEAFVAYGSCSFSEPVEDLTGLGIFATP
jgi:hypothetical protein